jgi:hypothetical protein
MFLSQMDLNLSLWSNRWKALPMLHGIDVLLYCIGEVMQLKKAKDEYYSQLLESREQQRSQYEERLVHEMSRLKGTISAPLHVIAVEVWRVSSASDDPQYNTTVNSDKQMDELRMASREMFDKQMETLKESRDNAVDELEKMRSRCTELSSKHDQLKLQLIT